MVDMAWEQLWYGDSSTADSHKALFSDVRDDGDDNAVNDAQ